MPYFNHLAASVPSPAAVEGVTEYFARATRLGPASPEMEEWCAAEIAATRAAITRLLGADDAAEVALTSGGSEAIGLVAGGLDLPPHARIISTELEFVSNHAVWERLAAEKGVRVERVPALLPGVADIEALEAAVARGADLITLTHMPNSLGTLQPVAEIGTIARRYGCLYHVNAASTVGMVPIDVRRIGCDFLTASGRKYLRGPTGTGFLHVRRQLLSALRPPHLGWYNGEWDWEGNRFFPSPAGERFTPGEPSFPNFIGLGRAVLELEREGGVGKAWARMTELLGRLLDGMTSIAGVEVYGPGGVGGRGAMVSFNLRGQDPGAVARKLRTAGIIVEAGNFLCPGPLKLYGQREVVRICVHSSNREEELDEALAALKRISLGR